MAQERTALGAMDEKATTVTVLVADTPSTVPVTVGLPALEAIRLPVTPIASIWTTAGSAAVQATVRHESRFPLASRSVGVSTQTGPAPGTVLWTMVLRLGCRPELGSLRLAACMFHT